MSRQFLAAAGVGALVIAVAGLMLVWIAGPALPRMWPLITVWCFVPFAWGIWAALTPRTWLPGRLPAWGSILGLIAGLAGAFVLDLPSRIFEVPFSVAGRLVAVAAVTLLYYFLWMLVRAAYRKLIPSPTAETPAAGPQLRKVA